MPVPSAVPKNPDLKKILLLGSGPIVIGQGCEFDYSGVQACKALAEEGYEVVLINSNPATIMTDPEFAARTYIEPITVEIIEKIIVAERPDALLPTLGGQTALNAAIPLHENGVLEKYGVELTHGRRAVEAEVAGDALAASLGIAPGAAVLVLRSTSYAGQRPVEVFVAYHRADRSRFEVTLNRTRALR